jgi:hypothetical protein
LQAVIFGSIEVFPIGKEYCRFFTILWFSETVKSYFSSAQSIRILAGNRWCTHGGKSLIKDCLQRCVQDLGKATRKVVAPQWGAITKAKQEGKEREYLSEPKEFLERHCSLWWRDAFNPQKPEGERG